MICLKVDGLQQQKIMHTITIHHKNLFKLLPFLQNEKKNSFEYILGKQLSNVEIFVKNYYALHHKLKR